MKNKSVIKLTICYLVISIIISTKYLCFNLLKNGTFYVEGYILELIYKISYYFFMFIITVFLTTKIKKNMNMKIININMGSIFFIFVTVLLLIGSVSFNQFFLNYELEKKAIISMLVVNLAIVIVEEMWNRFIFIYYLEEILNSKVMIIIISSILYSSLHFVPSLLFVCYVNVITIINTLILGSVLGIIYMYERNIVYCICVHFYHNSIIDTIDSSIILKVYMIFIIYVLFFFTLKKINNNKALKNNK